MQKNEKLVSLTRHGAETAALAQSSGIRVKLERINCESSRSLPPDGDRLTWTDRLKAAFGTSSADFVDATLIQLQSAARLPNGGVSEAAVNSALAMIEGEMPRTETECAIVVQMACLHSATMAVLGRIGGGHGGEGGR